MFRGYIINDEGKHNGYVKLKNIKQVAKFIITNEETKIITNEVDQFVCDTFGSFINKCPNKIFLNELVTTINILKEE